MSRTSKKKRSSSSDSFNPNRVVMNVVESSGSEQDWSFGDALSARVIPRREPVPESVDLRARWWRVQNQGETGACVGYATAYGLLWRQGVTAGKISTKQMPSARFIWMANKETDGLTARPSTFLEKAPTQTKSALRIAAKYGCVLDRDLPMKGSLSNLEENEFYSRASRLKVASYFNLGRNVEDWKRWLAFRGPILTRLVPDPQFLAPRGVLDRYVFSGLKGGHAVCLAGYTSDTLIVRNSWGRSWGKRGYVEVSLDYAKQAFTEAYGAMM